MIIHFRRGDKNENLEKGIGTGRSGRARTLTCIRLRQREEDGRGIGQSPAESGYKCDVCAF